MQIISPEKAVVTAKNSKPGTPHPKFMTSAREHSCLFQTTWWHQLLVTNVPVPHTLSYSRPHHVRDFWYGGALIKSSLRTVLEKH